MGEILEKAENGGSNSGRGIGSEISFPEEGEECNHGDHRKIQMIKGEDSKQIQEEKSTF